MSSAAESPPGPRRASRSRGRSAAGRSRTERAARRCCRGVARRPSRVRHHPPARGRRAAVERAARARCPRGPDHGSPPISPAIRTREHDEAYGAGPYRGLNRACARLCERRSGPAARREEQQLDAVERRVEPDRRVQRPAGEEHPAEGEPDRQQGTGTRTAPAGRPSANEASNSVRTWAIAKNIAPRTIAGRAPDGPRPGGRREAAEEQLLADRGEDRRRTRG